MLMHTQSWQSIDNFPASPLKNILMLTRNSKAFTPSIEDRMVKRLQKETEDLYSKLGVLGAIASSAPFIGLFGTVWGIMSSFQGIAVSKNTSLAVVAPGIAEALLATAIGLFAAIPAVFFYNIFSAKINYFSERAVNFSSQILNLLSKELDR